MSLRDIRPRQRLIEPLTHKHLLTKTQTTQSNRETVTRFTKQMEESKMKNDSGNQRQRIDEAKSKNESGKQRQKEWTEEIERRTTDTKD